ncbi:MAG TPA: cytosine permease [Ktedonobacteraceae bacterium]|nr:cytosine permease [Ktedonobacteraceae bacterium]
MASDVVAIPEERGIETHGIERVSPSTRSHIRIVDNFTMWLSANLVISTVALGAIANPIFRLGFWDGLAVIIIFNALGVLPVAFFSTLGPKLGLRQMTITRFAFGWVGGIIMALFNVAACLGWSTVNVIIGGQLVNSLSNGAIPVWAGILVIAILTTLVSIYGYRYVHRYERYSWIPMAIIFLILFIVAVPHMKIIPTPVFGAAEIAGFISFGGAIYGFATGWSSYAADYNVNQPENTAAARVFWLTFLGVFIPCVLLETLGMAFTSWISNSSGGALLAGVAAPLGTFGSILVALLALSTVANNIPNDYSLGLSMQVLGKAFMRVPRYVWTLIGAVVYIVVAILLVTFTSSFNDTLNSFMLLVAYWLGPYAIILVIEHFVFRRGRYNVDGWNTASLLPTGWAAIVAMIIGLVGAYLGFSQALVLTSNTLGAIPGVTVTPFGCSGGVCTFGITGVLGGLVNGGMDIGFELGLVLAGISYLILRAIDVRTARDRVGLDEAAAVGGK